MGMLHNAWIFSFVFWFYANTNYILVDFTITHETEEGEIWVPSKAVSPNLPLAFVWWKLRTPVFSNRFFFFFSERRNVPSSNQKPHDRNRQSYFTKIIQCRAFLSQLSRLRTHLVSMRMRVQSPAWCSELKDPEFPQLQLRFSPWPQNFHMPGKKKNHLNRYSV